jgi:hypothetical protein
MGYFRSESAWIIPRARVDFTAAAEPVQIDVMNVDHRGEAAIIIAASRLALR